MRSSRASVSSRVLLVRPPPTTPSPPSRGSQSDRPSSFSPGGNFIDQASHPGPSTASGGGHPLLQGRAENAATRSGCCFRLRFPSALSQHRDNPSETAEKTCAQARPRPLPEAGRVAGSHGCFCPGPGRRAASGLRPLATVRLRERGHGVFFGR